MNNSVVIFTAMLSAFSQSLLFKGEFALVKCNLLFISTIAIFNVMAGQNKSF